MEGQDQAWLVAENAPPPSYGHQATLSFSYSETATNTVNNYPSCGPDTIIRIRHCQDAKNIANDNAENDLFRPNKCMILFLVGFLFPPFFVIGAIAGRKSSTKVEQVWGRANLFMSLFTVLLLVPLVIWAAVVARNSSS
ncbi:hypothetical protein HK100_012857 [Physocladia obscura]|uniref:Uncharacterized protein n=1 Tax=Physocladia obscura TaxID=109957 RepID=A0AAD5XCW6_9FUNG|nr:hypothetical protein HK100_012857 [Physocladia obscura]